MLEVLAKTYRGGLLDLQYTGDIAVVNAEGKLLWSAGDPMRVAFMRSSAKLMQSMVPLESGAVDAYGLTEQELAQLCASHNGEAIHVETVAGILQKAGLDESYLQCGPHLPMYEKEAQAMIARGEAPRDIHNNCSGKHSGMLITTKYLNEDLDTYYKPEHPHQQRIRNMIGMICNYDPAKIVIGLDGCGVPVHALPVYNFAWGIARMCQPETLGEKYGPMAQRIVNAMMHYPMNTSGTGRVDMAIMKHWQDKLVAKSGADGYFTIGLPGKGIGIAIKMDQGDGGPKNAVLLEVLRQIGFATEEDLKAEDLAGFYRSEPKNHKGEVVGYTTADFTLRKGGEA